MDVYFDILRDWERRVADPAVYEHLDTLFPAFSFRRIMPGGPKDHWASRFKTDLTLPKRRTAEKTVVYRTDMCFREQGNWSEPEGVMDRIVRENGLSSVYEAYRMVSRTLGLDMPRPDSSQVAEAIGRAERRNALIEVLVSYFMWNLENNRSAKASRTRTYLKKERGLSSSDTRRFMLGFVPDWSTVVRHVTIEKGFSLEELDTVCGVRNAEGYTAVGKTHVLAIPYECAGEVKGFIFRKTDGGDGPKYIASSGLDRKSVFFNMKADRDPKGILVVEGEFDAIKATCAGFDNVVAIGGADISGERRRQVEDALGRGVNRIFLCPDLDTDAEGNPDFAKRHQAVMRSVHTIKDVDFRFEEIFVVRFPSPADPDSFIREMGPGQFEVVVKAAVPYWKYHADYMEGRG